MKIIELLNKIANGEEVNMIELEGKRYKYIDNEFVDAGGCCFCGWLSSLNDEVEIIEKDKKIEKIEDLNSDYYVEARDCMGFTKEIALDIKTKIVLDIKTTKDKINEIIDKLNKEE